MPLPLAEPHAALPEQPAPPQERPRGISYGLYVAIALLVLLACLLHRLLLGSPIFPVDDAYITLHNAQVLHWGHDPNYSGTPAFAGATSAVHLALVALLLFALPAPMALWASLWLATLVYALGLVRLARVHGGTSTQALLLVLVGLAAGQVPHQLMNGLETGLALATVTWGLALAAEPPQSLPADAAPSARHLAWLPCLCGLLPFIRPDLLPLSLGLLALRTGRHFRAVGSWHKAIRPILRDLGLALMCAAPWALWYWASLGTPYPSTIEAKRLFFAQDVLPLTGKAQMTGKDLATFAGDIGLLAFFALRLGRTAAGWTSLLFGLALIGAYLLRFPGAFGFYEGRYLYPLLPLLLLGAASTFQAGSRLRIAATALLALCLVQSCWRAPDFWAKHQSFCGFTRHDLAGTADWCSVHLPPTATVLIHDAGYIAYGTRFHLVDMVGLKTPTSVAAHRALTHPSGGAGRGEAISRIALQNRCEYLIVLRGWETAFGPASGLRAQGWRVQLINDQYAYQVYALRPPLIAADGKAKNRSSGNK